MSVRRTDRLGTLLLAFGLSLTGGCVTTNSVNLGEAKPVENSTAKSVELSPAKSAQLHLALADSLEKNGHDADAAACYEKARGLDPSLTHVARVLATLYDRLGENKRALEEYQLALKAAPRDANLMNRLGYYYYTRAKWKEAEEQFRQAVAINPNLQRAWVNLGLTLGEQQRYEESLNAFVKAVSKAEALSNLGFVMTTQGKKEEARQKYREALDLDPSLRIAQLALQKLEHETAPPAAPAPTTTAQAPPAPALVPVSPLERAAPEQSPAVLPLLGQPPPDQAASSR